VRRFFTLELFQWYGLFGAALVWATQHVLAYGLTEARCGSGGHYFLPFDTLEIVFMVVAVILVLLAEAAAIVVFLRTRSLEHDDPPPDGRHHFFAAGAMAGNVLFLMIILMTGIGIVANSPCHQS
jgi:hypothetical protein